MASRKKRTTRKSTSTSRFFFTAPPRNWCEPEVTLGEPKPIPEKRPEILQKILSKLEAQPEGFRQDYSNGEFISSSLCIAKTFEDCKKVRTLDTSSYTVHFDEQNKLYWRHGGFFDSWYTGRIDKYTCEVETTVAGLDVLVHGSIERVVTGVAGAGAPVEEHHVVVEDVFAAVTMETNAPGCYCDYPLASIPIAWKDELVGAICARSEADWERWEEDKWRCSPGRLKPA